MNKTQYQTGCAVCGGTVSGTDGTFCTSCEQQVLMAIQALREGGSVVIVPPRAN